MRMEREYDLLVVGAGLFGATYACMAHRQGKKCLVIDKRPHLGGNIYKSASLPTTIDQAGYGWRSGQLRLAV